MSIEIRKARNTDIAAVGQLYDEVNEHLCQKQNYVGWQAGVYPTAEDAERGVMDNALYLAEWGGAVAGAIIINHEAAQGYSQVSWGLSCKCSEVLVLHTLAVSPKHLNCGIAKALLAFAENLAVKAGIMAIRFDVNEKNAPAICLYEKCGYKHRGTKALGYGGDEITMFRLYEKLMAR